jgi:hypothetical protein
VSDIFREVEEDVRRERFAQIWKKYGDYIMAGAALVVIVAAGVQLWRVHDQSQRATASQDLNAAIQLLGSGQANDAAQTLAKLAENAPGGYAKLAQLEQADALYAAGNQPEAVDLYKRVAAQNDPILGPVARLRAGWAIVESAQRSDLDALLAPLVDPTSPWRPLAQEIQAYADYQAGNVKGALQLYSGIAGNRDAPAAVRERSHAMAVFLAGGGDRNFGSVPAPPPQPAQAASPPAQGPQTP